MTHSDTLAAQLGHRTEHLDRIFDRIISCHVVVELVGHHHRHGDRYRVSINLGLPGQELLATHDPPDDRNEEPLHATADRAFDEISRQLDNWVRRRRGSRHAKVHDST
jgi:ribosome-associated translation inhibitor RaiA